LEGLVSLGGLAMPGKTPDGSTGCAAREI
jgi:hypothetical protein